MQWPRPGRNGGSWRTYGRTGPRRDRGDRVGIVSISLLNASGSTPEATVTGSYRGAKLERHLRPKARLEAVVADDAVSPVVETITSVSCAS